MTSTVRRVLRFHAHNQVSVPRDAFYWSLLAAATPSETLAILVGVSVIFGAVGYFAWIFKVQEAVLFYPFFFGFFAYHAWIQREWEKIEWREAGIPSELPEHKQKAAPAA